MLSAKWNLCGTIAIVIVLGSLSSVWGQPQAVSPGAAATGGVIPPPAFRPLTEADVQDDLAQVKTAAAAIDERFAAAADSAEGWKQYLSWTAFQAELQKAKPDTKVLSDVYQKLAAGYEGLELKCFADLRAVLSNYLAIAGSVGSPDLAAAVKGEIDGLAQDLKTIGPHPTAEQSQKIADHVLWLDMARQTPYLLKDARDRFSVPNFQVHIGKDLLDTAIGGPVDDVAPIDDVILDTTIHGMGHTEGQTSVALNADSGYATFDAMMQGVNHSNSVGRNGPVCIYTTGETCLAACKRFWIDDSGFHVYPAAASAQVNTTINNIVSIKGRGLVEKIAWRRAGQQKCEAEAIASQHAAARLGARIDAQADPSVTQANERFQAKVRKPLEERRAYPRSLRFYTLPWALVIEGSTVAQAQLAAPTAPPQLACQADSGQVSSIIAVCVHESTINNFAESVFTGMRLNDDLVQRTAIEFLGKLPDKLKPDQDQEPFSIVFPPEQIPRVQPVTVTFADGGFTVTLSGLDFASGDRHQRKTNIRASYKFVKTPDGYKAVRQGDLQIYGFRDKPDKKRGVAQQGIVKVLQAKFGKIFEPEIKLQGFKFSEGKLAAAGQYVPQEIISENGWLAIGYARAKPAGATAANN